MQVVLMQILGDIDGIIGVLYYEEILGRIIFN